MNELIYGQVEGTVSRRFEGIVYFTSGKRRLDGDDGLEGVFVGELTHTMGKAYVTEKGSNILLPQHLIDSGDFPPVKIRQLYHVTCVTFVIDGEEGERVVTNIETITPFTDLSVLQQVGLKNRMTKPNIVSMSVDDLQIVEEEDDDDVVLEAVTKKGKKAKK